MYRYYVGVYFRVSVLHWKVESVSEKILVLEFNASVCVWYYQAVGIKLWVWNCKNENIGAKMWD